MKLSPGLANATGWDAARDRFELDGVGAERSRFHVRQIIGDRLKPLLKRDLSGQADIERGLHANYLPIFRFCRLARVSALIPISIGWLIRMEGVVVEAVGSAFWPSHMAEKRCRNVFSFAGS